MTNHLYKCTSRQFNFELQEHVVTKEEGLVEKI